MDSKVATGTPRIHVGNVVFRIEEHGRRGGSTNEARRVWLNDQSISFRPLSHITDIFSVVDDGCGEEQWRFLRYLGHQTEFQRFVAWISCGGRRRWTMLTWCDRCRNLPYYVNSKAVEVLRSTVKGSVDSRIQDRAF